jgi:hypothetical protein
MVLVFKILLNQRIASSRLFLGEKENQNQRTAGSGYLKNFKKEQVVFMKEQVKNWWLYRHS